MSRVLVAAERGCPVTALAHAAAIAGRRGEVVLATVLVVPHSQPLEATLDRAVAAACADLDAGERAAAEAGSFDTRLVRARSFSEGILETAAAEPWDAIVLEAPRGTSFAGGSRGQIEMILDRAAPTVLLVRPASPAHAGKQPAALV